MICPACHAENIEAAVAGANCGLALAGLDLPGAPQGSQAPAFVLETIAALPQREPVSVGVSDPVALAVRLMQTQDVGCVLVMDGQRLAGVITGWDILQKVAGPNEDLNAVACRQVMSANPTLLREEDSVALALNVMASFALHHVPLLRDGRAVGILNVADVFRYLSPHLA